MINMDKKSLKEEAYNIIKSKIISCEYLPNTFLNEGILKEEIGVSRTPIRDAIGRLEQENLVKIIPKKGIVVTDLSINEINMIYESRMLLEPYSIKKYGNKLNKNELMNFRNFFTRKPSFDNVKELYQEDDKFHRMIIGATQNKYIMLMYENIQIQNWRIRILSGNKLGKRMSESTPEHLKILDAALADNFDEAAFYLQEHLKNAKNAAFSLILSNGGWALKQPDMH
jgi:GntR family transcriptional regulator, rspAB operon transcriptional repressor